MSFQFAFINSFHSFIYDVLFISTSFLYKSTKSMCTVVHKHNIVLSVCYCVGMLSTVVTIVYGQYDFFNKHSMLSFAIYSMMVFHLEHKCLHRQRVCLWRMWHERLRHSWSKKYFVYNILIWKQNTKYLHIHILKEYQTVTIQICQPIKLDLIKMPLEFFYW